MADRRKPSARRRFPLQLSPEEERRAVEQLPPEIRELQRQSEEGIRRLREFARTGRISGR